MNKIQQSLLVGLGIVLVCVTQSSMAKITKKIPCLSPDNFYPVLWERGNCRIGVPAQSDIVETNLGQSWKGIDITHEIRSTESEDGLTHISVSLLNADAASVKFIKPTRRNSVIEGGASKCNSKLMFVSFTDTTCIYTLSRSQRPTRNDLHPSEMSFRGLSTERPIVTGSSKVRRSSLLRNVTTPSV